MRIEMAPHNGLTRVHGYMVDMDTGNTCACMCNMYNMYMYMYMHSACCGSCTHAQRNTRARPEESERKAHRPGENANLVSVVCVSRFL